jgi:hypothetical protein
VNEFLIKIGDWAEYRNGGVLAISEVAKITIDPGHETLYTMTDGMYVWQSHITRIK